MIGQQQVRVPTREGAGRDGGASGDGASAAGSGWDVADRVREVEPMVRAICRGRLGTVDGDDAAQRTLLGVWRALDGGREIKSVPAYAAACARYGVLSSYRDSRRRATPSGEWAEQRWADEAPGPAEQAERVDEVAAATERVEALLGQLPPRQAEVIRAGVLSGRSTAQTAQVLGITPTGVHSAQVRAMARLRELCGTRSANPLDAAITQSFKRVTSVDREFTQYRDQVGLDAVLAGLPPQTRRVVHLRFTQDVPVAVVTQQLDLGKHTVQRLTQEGLAALRAQLGEGHPPGDSPEQRKDTVLGGPAALPDQHQHLTDADADREFPQYHDRVGLDAAVAGLPPEARRVVQLRFTHGLPVTVVARQLHRGTTHVRALTEAALAALRAQLLEQDPADELPGRQEELLANTDDLPDVGAAGGGAEDADAAGIPDRDPDEQAPTAVATVPAPRAAPGEDGHRDQPAPTLRSEFPVEVLMTETTPSQPDRPAAASGSPTVAEIAALTARLRHLSNAGPQADTAEREAFLADKHALLDRITTTHADDDATADAAEDRVDVAGRDGAVLHRHAPVLDRWIAEHPDLTAATGRSGAEEWHPLGSARLDLPSTAAELDAVRDSAGWYGPDPTDERVARAEAVMAQALTTRGITLEPGAADPRDVEQGRRDQLARWHAEDSAADRTGWGAADAEVDADSRVRDAASGTTDDGGVSW